MELKDMFHMRLVGHITFVKVDPKYTCVVGALLYPTRVYVTLLKEN